MVILNRALTDYKGTVGSMQHPEFRKDYKVSYDELPSGTHTLENKNTREVVFIDRFCLESGTSDSQPSSGPGITEDGTGARALANH